MDITYVGYDEDGQIVGGSVVLKEGESIKVVKAPKQTTDYKKVQKNRDKLQKMSDELGGFYFMLYYDNKLFDGRVDEKHICRLIYLATLQLF